MKSSSNIKPEMVECTNEEKDIWLVRWDVVETKNDRQETIYEYQEERFDHAPTEEEVRKCICNYCNSVTDKKILTGFQWNGEPVWLSMENQFNYKATYDLAVQTNGANLPVTFKLGTDETPTYVTFNTVEELGGFYVAALSYVQKCYTDGWAEKAAINASLYASKIQSHKGND